MLAAVVAEATVEMAVLLLLTILAAAEAEATARTAGTATKAAVEAADMDSTEKAETAALITMSAATKYMLLAAVVAMARAVLPVT